MLKDFVWKCVITFKLVISNISPTMYLFKYILDCIPNEANQENHAEIATNQQSYWK